MSSKRQRRSIYSGIFAAMGGYLTTGDGWSALIMGIGGAAATEGASTIKMFAQGPERTLMTVAAAVGGPLVVVNGAIALTRGTYYINPASMLVASGVPLVMTYMPLTFIV